VEIKRQNMPTKNFVRFILQFSSEETLVDGAMLPHVSRIG